MGWYEDHAEQDESIRLMCEVLAWKSGTVYFIQCVVRYFARAELQGHKFTNHIFWVSFVSCVFCLITGVGASYQKEWSWKAEPIALACFASLVWSRACVSSTCISTTRTIFSRSIRSPRVI